MPFELYIFTIAKMPFEILFPGVALITGAAGTGE